MSEFGVDIDTLLRQQRLNRIDLSSSENKILPELVAQLLEECASAANCRRLGVLLGQRARLQLWGELGELMKTASTLGDAVADLIRYHMPYAGPVVIYKYRQGDAVVIAFRSLLRGDPGVQMYLALITATASMMREISGQRPISLQLACVEQSLDLFGVRSEPFPAKVDFNSFEYSISYKADALGLPVRCANPKVHRSLADRMVKGCDFQLGIVERVQRLLLPMLNVERGHMRLLSDALFMHPRTLNRRLRQKGTSVRQLVNQARFEIAVQLLRDTSLTKSSIAEALGYSEPCVFTRAFRHWAGAPPSQWRPPPLIHEAA